MTKIFNKQQHNFSAIIFFVFTLLISGFMFSSCGNEKEPESPLEKALNDHEVAYAKLLQKGNDLRTAVASSTKLNVDETLNNLKNLDANKGKSDAAIWKLLVGKWNLQYPSEVELLGIAPLLAEIDKLADEVLKLEAQIAELGEKPRVGQNNAPAYS